MVSVIAFDFDGVLVDSSPEIRHTALATWSRLHPDSDLQARWQADPAVRRLLDDLIPLGNRAEDFGVACHILNRSARVTSQSAYNAFKATLDPESLETYHRAFYRTRAEFRVRDPGAWASLQAPYPGVLDALRRRRSRHTYAIATAKDAASVRFLLESAGAGDLFPDDLLFDKDTGVAKTVHLRAIAETTATPLVDITFIDDKVNHLQTVAPLGIRAVLADWGHNTRREHRLARDLGFEVMSLDDVETRLLA
jgi:phosphoglycolate phosphatase-like HAD superfamily hydrolase